MFQEEVKIKIEENPEEDLDQETSNEIGEATEDFEETKIEPEVIWAPPPSPKMFFQMLNK